MGDSFISHNKRETPGVMNINKKIIIFTLGWMDNIPYTSNKIQKNNDDNIGILFHTISWKIQQQDPMVT